MTGRIALFEAEVARLELGALAQRLQQELERYRWVELAMARGEDHAHPALTEHLRDLVFAEACQGGVGNHQQ
jgi:hypothetical protein